MITAEEIAAQFEVSNHSERTPDWIVKVVMYFPNGVTNEELQRLPHD
jgi:hypothetical protein